MWVNTVHVLQAVIILALLDCVLTAYAIEHGFAEANPVTRFFMQTFGVIPGLLVEHYVPIAIAWCLWHFTGNLTALGCIVDGCIAFGMASIWDSWQLHRAHLM